MPMEFITIKGMTKSIMLIFKINLIGYSAISLMRVGIFVFKIIRRVKYKRFSQPGQPLGKFKLKMRQIINYNNREINQCNLYRQELCLKEHQLEKSLCPLLKNHRNRIILK